MRQYDDFEVQAIAEEEGLEYAVRHYMSADCCKNPETQKLWREAAGALERLAKHLHLDD